MPLINLSENRNVINFCLEKGQKIQPLTLALGLIGHHNDLVDWMIEEGKQKNHFDEAIETLLSKYH